MMVDCNVQSIDLELAASTRGGFSGTCSFVLTIVVGVKWLVCARWVSPPESGRVQEPQCSLRRHQPVQSRSSFHADLTLSQHTNRMIPMASTDEGQSTSSRRPGERKGGAWAFTSCNSKAGRTGRCSAIAPRQGGGLISTPLEIISSLSC